MDEKWHLRLVAGGSSSAASKQRKALQHDDERILWGSIKVGVLNFWIALLIHHVHVRTYVGTCTCTYYYV